MITSRTGRRNPTRRRHHPGKAVGAPGGWLWGEWHSFKSTWASTRMMYRDIFRLLIVRKQPRLLAGHADRGGGISSCGQDKRFLHPFGFAQGRSSVGMADSGTGGIADEREGLTASMSSLHVARRDHSAPVCCSLPAPFRFVPQPASRRAASRSGRASRLPSLVHFSAAAAPAMRSAASGDHAARNP